MKEQAVKMSYEFWNCKPHRTLADTKALRQKHAWQFALACSQMWQKGCSLNMNLIFSGNEEISIFYWKQIYSVFTTNSMDMSWGSSGSWWWTGKPGMLQSVGSQSRTRLSDWTELFPVIIWSFKLLFFNYLLQQLLWEAINII